MGPRRLLATLIALALLGATLLAPVAGADPSARDLHEAAAFKLATEAIVAAQGTRAGATWDGLDAATKSIVARRIQRIKDEREALAALARAELDRYAGKDGVCERAQIEQEWKEADAGLERYLVRLRHVRGDQQKALTKMGRFINRNVFKPLGKVAKQALRKSLPELAAIYIDGGGLSRAIVKSVLKRNVVPVVRKEGQDLLIRVVSRKFHGPGAITTEEALEAACGKQAAKVSPAPSDQGGSSDADVGAAIAACEGWTPEIPAPPFGEYAIIIRFDWPETDKYTYHYYATASTDPVNDPGDFALGPERFASWRGGCPPDADPALAGNACSRLDPLILTEDPLDAEFTRDGAPIPHETHASQPGSYTLAAYSGDICLFADVPGVISHYERLANDRAEAPGAVELTATIEYYYEGATTPHRTESRSAMVPLTYESTHDPQDTRTFGEPIVLPAAGAVGGSDQDAPWDQE